MFKNFGRIAFEDTYYYYYVGKQFGYKLCIVVNDI